MTVVIPEPDETPADDTNIVVAPVIVNSPPAEPDTDDTDETVEAVIVEETIDLTERVTRLESRVNDLEYREIVAPIVEPEPDITIDASDDAEVIVADDSPIGVPWTHKKPAFFGRD